MTDAFPGSSSSRASRAWLRFSIYPPPDRTRLIEEIALASRILQAATNCQKLNTAALGMIVHQLHFHVVARFADDIAGVGTVWGAGERVPYEAATRDAIVTKIKRGFGFA